MHVLDCVGATRLLLQERPDARVVALTSFSDRQRVNDVLAAARSATCSRTRARRTCSPRSAPPPTAMRRWTRGWPGPAARLAAAARRHAQRPGEAGAQAGCARPGQQADRAGPVSARARSMCTSAASSAARAIAAKYFYQAMPHWPEDHHAPDGAPNVIVVALDDVGFAQLGCYGSDIATSHIDALAAEGLQYTNCHTTALVLCQPGQPADRAQPSPASGVSPEPSAPDCQDEGMRIDPDPAGPELVMLSQYLDYQRETMLSKTEGLTRQQLAQQHPPSQLTLAGLLNHLSLVKEDWMEVRFAGLPDREPWASWTGSRIRTGSSALRLSSNRSSCRAATARPASAAGMSYPPRRAWISYRPGRCVTGGTSRSGGCCCTSSRRLPATPATQTSSAKRSMARSVSSEVHPSATD